MIRRLVIPLALVLAAATAEGRHARPHRGRGGSRHGGSRHRTSFYIGFGHGLRYRSSGLYVGLGVYPRHRVYYYGAWPAYSYAYAYPSYVYSYPTYAVTRPSVSVAYVAPQAVYTVSGWYHPTYGYWCQCHGYQRASLPHHVYHYDTTKDAKR